MEASLRPARLHGSWGSHGGDSRRRARPLATRTSSRHVFVTSSSSKPPAMQKPRNWIQSDCWLFSDSVISWFHVVMVCLFVCLFLMLLSKKGCLFCWQASINSSTQLRAGSLYSPEREKKKKKKSSAYSHARVKKQKEKKRKNRGANSSVARVHLLHHRVRSPTLTILIFTIRFKKNKKKKTRSFMQHLASWRIPTRES